MNHPGPMDQPCQPVELSKSNSSDLLGDWKRREDALVSAEVRRRAEVLAAESKGFDALRISARHNYRCIYKEAASRRKAAVSALFRSVIDAARTHEKEEASTRRAIRELMLSERLALEEEAELQLELDMFRRAEKAITLLLNRESADRSAVTAAAQSGWSHLNGCRRDHYARKMREMKFRREREKFALEEMNDRRSIQDVQASTFAAIVRLQLRAVESHSGRSRPGTAPERKRGGSTEARAVEQFRKRVKETLERAPFPEVSADADRSAAMSNLSEGQLRDFSTLFDVLSDRQDVITVSHIQSLLVLFTPCGCDDDEAAMFIREECGGIPSLNFEQFILFGGQLRRRIFAWNHFEAAPSERAKAQMIAQRVGRENLATAPLRRYERMFMRLRLAHHKEKDERKSSSPSPSPLRPQQEERSFCPRPPEKSKSRSEEKTLKVRERVNQPSTAQTKASSCEPRQEERAPFARLPPARFASQGQCGRDEVHARRLSRDSNLVMDLRSMYLI